jgi:Xaa-Pro aminopeptidase
LLKNTYFQSFKDNTLNLYLESLFANLLTEVVQKSILNTLKNSLGQIKLTFAIKSLGKDTLAQKQAQSKKEIKQQQQAHFLSHKSVQALQEVFQAKVNIGSIQKIREK